MDKLLLSLKNKKHSQMPIIILPCVCCLKNLLSLQESEVSKHACDHEVKKDKREKKTKKHNQHTHHHHKNITKEKDEDSNKNGEEIEAKKKRRHSPSNEVVKEHKKSKKSKKEKKKEKEVEEEEIIESTNTSPPPPPPSHSNHSSQINNNDNKVDEKIEEKKEKEKEINEIELNNGDNEEEEEEFKIKKAEFRLRISKPQWIPPRVKYGERIDNNPKPKKQRKPRKKPQKLDEECIEKKRNSISFTPTVEKKREPYFNLQSVESEYESIENPLVGDKIQFKVFDCDMEGDEVSFPSFTESDIMTGDVLEKNVINDIEHLSIKLENGDIKLYQITLMSDVRLISRSSQNSN